MKTILGKALGKFERLTVAELKKSKFVWLNDENLPGMKGAPLYMVINEGTIEGESLTKREYLWLKANWG